METPPSLLERLKRPDDPAAWARLVDLYTPLLYYWARRTGLQEADAADLVQDVLVILFRKLPEFEYDRTRSFRNWLKTITLNKWREKQRRRSPQTVGRTTALDDIAGQDEQAILEDAEYQQHLIGRALKLLESEFPAATWAAFREYVLRGRPAETVAAELGFHLGTVYAVKSRVLSRLRRELEGLLD